MVRRCHHPLFKGRHFDQEIIILCVRWYVTYKSSYRDLSVMMLERGLSVAPSTSGGSNGTCPNSRSAGIDSLVRSAVPGALTRPTSWAGLRECGQRAGEQRPRHGCSEVVHVFESSFDGMRAMGSGPRARDVSPKRSARDGRRRNAGNTGPA